jgi:hypothetical protein
LAEERIGTYAKGILLESHLRIELRNAG